MTGDVGRLACGRDARLLEVVADGRAEPADPADAAHLRGCPHCRAELASLRARWAQVRTAAEQPVPVPVELARRVLETVRAVRGGLVHRNVETRQDLGMLRVTEPAVMLLARRLALDVTADLPGVRCLGLGGDLDGLRVRLAVRYGLPMVELAARVADTVGRKLAQALGTAAPPVHAVVEDVLEPDRSR